jgi:hypothetical protein
MSPNPGSRGRGCFRGAGRGAYAPSGMAYPSLTGATGFARYISGVGFQGEPFEGQVPSISSVAENGNICGASHGYNRMDPRVPRLATPPGYYGPVHHQPQHGYQPYGIVRGSMLDPNRPETPWRGRFTETPTPIGHMPSRCETTARNTGGTTTRSLASSPEKEPGHFHQARTSNITPTSQPNIDPTSSPSNMPKRGLHSHRIVRAQSTGKDGCFQVVLDCSLTSLHLQASSAIPTAPQAANDGHEVLTVPRAEWNVLMQDIADLKKRIFSLEQNSNDTIEGSQLVSDYRMSNMVSLENDNIFKRHLEKMAARSASKSRERRPSFPGGAAPEITQFNGHGKKKFNQSLSARKEAAALQGNGDRDECSPAPRGRRNSRDADSLAAPVQIPNQQESRSAESQKSASDGGKAPVSFPLLSARKTCSWPAVIVRHSCYGRYEIERFGNYDQIGDLRHGAARKRTPVDFEAR